MHWTGKVLGWASMTRGVMQITPLGMDIRDVSFRAEARDAGRLTALEITNVQGKARSETDNVKAAATLYLDGLRLERANGWLRLAMTCPCWCRACPRPAPQAWPRSNSSARRTAWW